MALLDNRYVQILLVLFAVYMIMQMNKKPSPEHMDTVVNVDTSGTQVTVNGETVAQVPSLQSSTPLTATVTTSGPAPAQTPLPAEQNAITSPPFALASTTSPSPLTAIEEQLLSSAPAAGIGEENILFNPEPVDYDQIFNRRDNVEPSELLPKVDTSELYGDLKENPALAGNFLQNAWQLGIETSAGKRNFVQDLRGAIPIQAAVVSPWGNPTGIGPDLNRRSLGDIS